MTTDAADVDLTRTAVIIPALNEAPSLGVLLPMLRSMPLGQTIVCDNGSTDDTRAVAESNGVTWIREPKRGYGAACWAGMQHLASSIEIVVFLDADLSDDATMLPELVRPIVNGECDFVVSTRVPRLREPGSMTFPQHAANILFPILIRLGWGHRFTDMGPFRAITRESLDAIGMHDRAFGWTIEMQIRAVELGLCIREFPVPYRRRKGRSKISGTVRGVVLAAYWIIRTCVGLWLTKRRRMTRPERPV